MSRRRLLLPVAALVALCLGSPAPAAAIVHGAQVLENGVYPAQGVLRVDNDENPGFDRFCGGTLIGSRQFVTAANCVSDPFGDNLPEGKLLVKLGNVDRVPDTDNYTVTSYVRAPGYTDSPKPTNDVAVLTLDRVANYEPVRVVDDLDVWTPGTLATVLGWGRIGTGDNFAQNLRKVEIPIAVNDRCQAAYAAAFKPAVMLCAADPLGTLPSAARDSCESDEGGPLLVPDGTAVGALAGIVSWLRTDCGDPAQPGVYTRLGDDPLNGWVHSKTPEADWKFVLNRQPQANVPFEITSTSRHPEGDDYFTTFRWDVGCDGTFENTGKRITLKLPSPGKALVGVEASRPATASSAEGDKATACYQFEVGNDPNAAPPGTTPTGPTTPLTTNPVATAPLASISSAKRPKVGRRGRFAVRVHFARTAPRGTAVIEVFRGKRKIGIARTRVRRGASKRVKVKLTPTGRRLLARSKTKRLKVRVRVRVGRTVLRSKTLTVRR